MNYPKRRRTTYARVTPTGEMSVRVAHREYLQDIQMSVAFSDNSYDLNPGLIGTFPWLHSFARNFSQYTFHKLVFEFVSSSGEHSNAATPALGVVVMASSLDAHDANFVTKQQMENRAGAVSARPTKSFRHYVNCKNHGKLYVREQSPADNQDHRLYDVGNFTVATQGGAVANAYTCGELYVSYVVEFYRPEVSLLMPPPRGFRVDGDSGTAANPLGAAATLDDIVYNTLGIVVGDGTDAGMQATNIVLNFPANRAGYYKLLYQTKQTAHGSTVTTWSPAGGCRDLVASDELSLTGTTKQYWHATPTLATDGIIIQHLFYNNGNAGTLSITPGASTWGGNGSQGVTLEIVPLKAF